MWLLSNAIILIDICKWNIDGLVQEWHNSCALALELRPSCINPSIYNPVRSEQQLFQKWDKWTQKIAYAVIYHYIL